METWKTKRNRPFLNELIWIEQNLFAPDTDAITRLQLRLGLTEDQLEERILEVKQIQQQRITNDILLYNSTQNFREVERWTRQRNREY
jgi:hypothetical protein